MSWIHKYCCEVCGVEKRVDNDWFMAEVMPNGILVSPWREEHAHIRGVHHFCEEAHVQAYVSQYLASPEMQTVSRAAALNPKEKDLTSVQSHLLTRVMQESGELNQETDEIFDLLAAAEAALKGRVTIDSFNIDRFDA